MELMDGGGGADKGEKPTSEVTLDGVRGQGHSTSGDWLGEWGGSGVPGQGNNRGSLRRQCVIWNLVPGRNWPRGGLGKDAPCSVHVQRP